MPVDDDRAAAAAASVSVNMQTPMVRCNAMAWTEEEGLLKIVVMRSDPIAGTLAVTEEQAVPRAPLTGTAAERRVMECKWCEKLWQAMPRVEKRKSSTTERAVERAAKRQCKKDERQTEALLAKARDWSAHVFDPKNAESVTCKAALVKECLRDARALFAKSQGEKLLWLECLPKGIRESERLAARRKRWEERGAKAGEFMVERKPKHEDEISTDDEE